MVAIARPLAPVSRMAVAVTRSSRSAGRAAPGSAIAVSRQIPMIHDAILTMKFLKLRSHQDPPANQQEQDDRPHERAHRLSAAPAREAGPEPIRPLEALVQEVGDGNDHDDKRNRHHRRSATSHPGVVDRFFIWTLFGHLLLRSQPLFGLARIPPRAARYLIAEEQKIGGDDDDDDDKGNDDAPRLQTERSFRASPPTESSLCIASSSPIPEPG